MAARKKATQEMWEEEERVQTGSHVRKQFVKIVELGTFQEIPDLTEVGAIPVWPAYASVEGIVSKFIFSNFKHSLVNNIQQKTHHERN